MREEEKEWIKTLSIGLGGTMRIKVEAGGGKNKKKKAVRRV